MASENEFLFHALLTGIYITFLYDILRVLRRVFPHGNFLVSVEDIVFWIYCAAKVFLLMYHESNGTLRWFAIFGAISGMLLYLKLVSPFFVRYVAFILKKLLGVLGRIGRFISRPAVRLWRNVRERVGRAARRRAVRLRRKSELYHGFWKKKLTLLRKMLKMNS
jgi:spore cortex biosynthesis protein YabQ